jgi:hypothetical protein
MKIKSALLLSMAIFSSFLLTAQEYDQVMYVASQLGLKVRSSPSTNGAVLVILKCNDPVKYRPISALDTIEMRIASWVEYENVKGVKGYVFGGYLNTYMLPKERYVSLRDYIKSYVLANFEELENATHLDDKPGEKFDEMTKVSIGVDYFHRELSQWEYSDNEYMFRDVDINEVINIIEYCEFNGEKVEYSLLRQSYEKENNLSLFKYSHAINDPPEDDIVIEALYPTGVRIKISGGL